jgi:serine/threonine protein phosphatase PrpC
MVTNQGSREYNEDSADSIRLGDNFCFVVADGLGGHGKGEVASQKVIEVCLREFANYTANEKFLTAAFTNSQAEILAKQDAEGDKTSMKTTAVCLSVIDGVCQWGHIGDSRLYAFHKKKSFMSHIVERTLDHSVPQMLVLTGDIKEKNIPHHPDRNRLLRVLGVEWDSPKYELSQETELNIYHAFLLCTDGFWELVSTKKMGSFL